MLLDSPITLINSYSINLNDIFDFILSKIHYLNLHSHSLLTVIVTRNELQLVTTFQTPLNTFQAKYANQHSQCIVEYVRHKIP